MCSKTAFLKQIGKEKRNKNTKRLVSAGDDHFRPQILNRANIKRHTNSTYLGKEVDHIGDRVANPLRAQLKSINKQQQLHPVIMIINHLGIT